MKNRLIKVLDKTAGADFLGTNQKEKMLFDQTPTWLLTVFDPLQNLFNRFICRNLSRIK